MIPVKLKQWSLGLLAVALLAVTLTGCGSVKSAWVAARFGAALKANPVTSVSGTVNGNALGKVLGLETESRLQLDFQAQLDPDTEKTCTDFRAGLDLWGSKLTQDFRIYSIPKDDSTQYYVHLDRPDLWARSSTAWDGALLWKLDPAMLLLLAEGGADSAQMTVSEEYYDFNLTLRAGEILELISKVGAKLSPEFQNMDLQAITVPVELRVSRESFLPKNLKMQIQGLSGPLLKQILKAAGMEPRGAEISGGTFELILHSFGYGPREVPTLPEEAAADSARMEEVFKVLKKLLT